MRYSTEKAKKHTQKQFLHKNSSHKHTDPWVKDCHTSSGSLIILSYSHKSEHVIRLRVKNFKFHLLLWIYLIIPHPFALCTVPLFVTKIYAKFLEWPFRVRFASRWNLQHNLRSVWLLFVVWLIRPNRNTYNFSRKCSNRNILRLAAPYQKNNCMKKFYNLNGLNVRKGTIFVIQENDVGAFSTHTWTPLELSFLSNKPFSFRPLRREWFN